ncbi:MAG: DUF1697 domain-containing protein [Myxococcota bacterium]
MMAVRGQRRVALLRGVNVGGSRKLLMSDLVAACEAAGCREVETYIQSGNVAFGGGDAAEAKLAARLRAAIAEVSGLDVPVVVRSGAELAALIAANPHLAGDPEISADTLHVMFLADHPTAARVGALDPARSPPDTFAVLGREVFLRCPDGLGRSKLSTAWFDKGLATISTCRNWRTVLRLAEMTRG